MGKEEESEADGFSGAARPPGKSWPKLMGPGPRQADSLGETVRFGMVAQKISAFHKDCSLTPVMVN
jgi:hypothetical protein